MTRPSYSVRIEGQFKDRVISYNSLAREFIPANVEIQSYIADAILKLYTSLEGGNLQEITPLTALESLQARFQVSFASVVEAAIYSNTRE